MGRAIRILVVGVLTAAGLFLAEPVADAGLGDLVRKVRKRLDPVLLTGDLLVEPGREVQLKAGLRTGLRLEGIAGKRIQFFLGGELLGEARSDEAGNAAIRWKVPKPGDYVVRVRVHPDDQPERRAPDVRLFVAARTPTTPIVVVDLDKTLVGSSFVRVLTGGAKPMPAANVVMQRLAENHTVVYLTHRPDFLGPTSKQWLARNRFPPGPVLTSTMGTFFSGSGRFKTSRLKNLKSTYKNLVLGIGDKFSDARAYAEQGLRSILILHVDWSKDDPEDYEEPADELAALPDKVQVVTNWSQIAEILFSGASYPKRQMEKRLREVARNLHRDDDDD